MDQFPSRWLNILYLEDNPEFLPKVQESLSHENVESDIILVQNERDFSDALTQVKFDLILADYRLSSWDGCQALKTAQNQAPDIPFIFLAEGIGEEKIVDVLKKGATDYVLKNNLERLVLAVTRALWETKQKKEKNRLQTMLEESEERFRTLVQSIPDVVYKIDINGYFTFVNNAVERFGYKAEELIGRHFSELIHAFDIDAVSRDRVLPKFEGVETGAHAAPKLFDERRASPRLTKNLQVRLIKKEAKKKICEDPAIAYVEVFAAGDYSLMDLNYYTWVEVNATGHYEADIFRSDKNFQGTVGVIRDISDRKNNEEILKKYEFIVNTSRDLMTLINRRYEFEAVSDSFCAFHCRSREEVLTFDSVEVWGDHEEFKKKLRLHLNRCFDGEEVNFQEWVKENCGNRKFLDIHFHPYRTSDGTISHAVMICHDLSEVKTAEEKRQEILHKLEVSNQDLRQFAYVASHDLKEPLRMVVSFLMLIKKRLLENGKSDDEISEFIGYAVEGAQRMEALINDLLKFSRVDSKALELEATDLNLTLKEILSNLKVMIEEKNAVVHVPNLPIIHADKTQMVQLFQNLISNAMKYCKTEINPKIHIQFTETESEYRFSVADNGIGIAEEHFDRIFYIFQRLHTRREYEGTGVGLAVCKKIVERHGGKIWVDSQEGQGSTFHFTLTKKNPAPIK